MWQQGSIFEELKAKESRLTEEEKALVAFRADLKVRRRKAPPYDVNDPGLSRVELEEQDEIYTIQLAAIKRQVDELKASFDALAIDLALHRKEMKRIRDEVRAGWCVCVCGCSAVLLAGRVALQARACSQRPLCADEARGQGWLL